MKWLVGIFCAFQLGACAHAPQGETPADAPVSIGSDQNKRYFLNRPKDRSNRPGLILVLPGGTGGAELRHLVVPIIKALPGQYVAAQLIAPRWWPHQRVVWPVAKVPVYEMGFSTPEFIDAAITDISLDASIDPNRVFLFCWSSSGIACYEATLTNPRIRGAVITASVFWPQYLSDVNGAKGKAFYISHSPDDVQVPFSMAEKAHSSLSAAGATVVLEQYEGGHNLMGNEQTRKAIEWLEASSRVGPTSGSSGRSALRAARR